MLATRFFENFKIYYRAESADEKVLQHSFENDIYLKAVPSYQPKPDHLIIDIGAHIGTFSLLMATKVKNGKVYAIEASQDNFQLLEKNVLENQLDNIFPLHLAIADKQRKMKLFHDSENGNWGHSITYLLSDKYEIVKAISLNQFFNQYQIQKCNLLKMNCEGAEFKIIAALKPVVFSRIERMIILYHTDLSKYYTLKELVFKLKTNAFEVEIKKTPTKRGWIIAQQNKKRKPQFLQFYLGSFYFKSKRNMLFGIDSLKNGIKKIIFYEALKRHLQNSRSKI